MSRTADKRLEDMAMQLAIQRKATASLQVLLARAMDNLAMLGRTDIVKSLKASADSVYKSLPEGLVPAAVPQPVPEPVDDDLF